MSASATGEGSCHAGAPPRGSRTGGAQRRNQRMSPVIASSRATTPRLVAATMSSWMAAGELRGREAANRTPPAAPRLCAHRMAPVARSSASSHAELSSRALLLRACTMTRSPIIMGSPCGNRSSKSGRASRSSRTSHSRRPSSRASAWMRGEPDRCSGSAWPGSTITASSRATATVRSPSGPGVRSPGRPACAFHSALPLNLSKACTCEPSASSSASPTNRGAAANAVPSASSESRMR